MSTAASVRTAHKGTTESAWVRRTLIGIALVFMFLFLVLPLAAVFTEALRKGLDAYLEALKDPDAWSAIRLTFLTAAIAVPLNLVFGVAAAWAVAKYEFRGKSFLTTLIDLPFSVSPVVAGLVFVLIYAATRPDVFHVERSTTIQAPPERLPLPDRLHPDNLLRSLSLRFCLLNKVLACRYVRPLVYVCLTRVNANRLVLFPDGWI